MTDDRPLDRPDLTPQEDELVSAVLDGEADPDQRRAFERDPVLRERVELLERVRSDLRTVEPAADDRREQAIAAAVGSAEHAASLSPIDTARSTRWRRGLAVAAAAAAFVIGVPLLALAFGGGSETESADSTGTASLSADQAEAGAAATSIPPLSAAVIDLGVIDTAEQVRAAIDAVLATPMAYTAPPTETATMDTSLRSEAGNRSQAPTDCSVATATADASLGPPVLTAAATWRGEPVLVVVHEGVPRVIVVSRDDCTVVARVEN